MPINAEQEAMRLLHDLEVAHDALVGAGFAKSRSEIEYAEAEQRLVRARTAWAKFSKAVLEGG